jgi:hypothetical protein
MGWGLSFLFSFLEALSVVFLFDAFLVRRKEGRAFWGIFLLFVSASFLITNVLHVPVSALKIGMILALYVSFALVLYQGTLLMRFLYAVLGYSTFYIISCAVVYLVLFVSGLSLKEFMQHTFLYLLCAF